jgi:hypothetical protein
VADDPRAAEPVKQIHLSLAEVERLLEGLRAGSQRSEDRVLTLKLIRLKHRFNRDASSPWAV